MCVLAFFKDWEHDRSLCEAMLPRKQCPYSEPVECERRLLLRSCHDHEVLVVVVADADLVLFPPSISSKSPPKAVQGQLRFSPLPLVSDAMAESKSTTTPTEASSSRTKDKDDTAGRRSSRSNAVTRSNPASPSKRKADDLAGGSRSSKRRAVADNTVSSSATQKAASVGPTSSKGKGKSKKAALPELELFKQRHTSLFPGGVVVKVEEPESDADNICVRAASPLIDPDDKERLLDFVLIDEFGSEARRLAVEQLFQAARQSAVSETDFCLTYVETTVGRLRQKGIKEERLAEVVAMLQAGVMEQLRARLDSLGGPLPSPVSLPPPPTNANSNIVESRSSQMVHVVVSHKGKQRPARSESVHTPSESSDSSSDGKETIVPGSHRSSRYRDDDDEEYDESSSRVARSQDFVKLEDGMNFFQLTRFTQPHANKVFSQIPPTAQKLTSESTVRANVTESRSTILLALSLRRACLRPVTTLQR